VLSCVCVFFFSSRRRHTRLVSDWSSDVCSSDLGLIGVRRVFRLFTEAEQGPAGVDNEVYGKRREQNRGQRGGQHEAGAHVADARSEERRVGKEGGSRGAADEYEKEGRAAGVARG